jgi:cellobiose phosphorylase
MYRLIIESLLGLTRTAHHLTLAPRMPEGWNTFTLSYRYGRSTYVIRVVKAEGGAPLLTVDGVPQHDQMVELSDTGNVHQVELLLPAPKA